MDPNGRLLWINSRVETITGYTSDECHAMSDFPLSLVAPQEWKKVREAIAGALHGTTGDDFVFRARRKDGSELWASANWRPIYSPDQAYLGLRLSVHDVTARREAENKLSDTLRELEKANAMQKEYLVLASDERARLNALLNAMQIGILFVDRNNRVIYSNPAFEHIWLLTRSKTRFIGMDAAALLLQTTDRLSRGDEALQDLLHLTKEGEPAPPVEVEMSDGRLITRVGLSGARFDRADGGIPVAVRGRHARAADRQPDPVPGRARRADRPVQPPSLPGGADAHAVERRAPAAARGAAVLRHRRVQARQRHLRSPRRRRAADSGGGRSVGAGPAQREFSRAWAATSSPFSRPTSPTRRPSRSPSASCGRSRAFPSASRATTCASPAAWAWRSIRTTPRPRKIWSRMPMPPCTRRRRRARTPGACTARTPTATTQMLARLSWNERIEDALENDLLRLHYQGVFHCSPLRLSHVEALVRMVDRDDPERVVMPSSFIPVAEKTGKILDIDRWVISACAAMLARSPGVAAIALNVSGRSLNEPTLPRFIIDALRTAGVVPSRLIVELTETSAVSDLHDAQRFIESMRESGVQGVPGRLRRRLLIVCLSEASGRRHAQDRRAVHPRSADRPRQPGVRESHRRCGARPQEAHRRRVRGGRRLRWRCCAPWVWTWLRAIIWRSRRASIRRSSVKGERPLPSPPPC